jgi:hypothetical protein
MGKVRDKDGGEREYSATVTVNNVPPVVSITAPGAEAIYALGMPVTFSGTFTDPGTADTHTARWLLDGVPVQASVSESGGSGTVSAIQTFVAPGVYEVKLVVSDDDGGSGEAFTVGGLAALVVVYDPAAGHVAGHGWIDSPVGAYRANPTLADRAKFGFESRYERGASKPAGKSEFRFKAADLDFTTTDYQWLVVSGARAQYTGTGTINGGGTYGFLLTAIDGQISGGGGTDKFRIKIWDKNNGDAVVYDNQLGADEGADPTTVIGGGNIQIKK